jgi:hypothetical protein
LGVRAVHDGNLNLIAIGSSSITAARSAKRPGSWPYATGAFERAERVLRREVHVLVHRPPQADPAITLPIALPNHPSIPSAHSCITSAVIAVLYRCLPERTDRAWRRS